MATLVAIQDTTILGTTAARLTTMEDIIADTVTVEADITPTTTGVVDTTQVAIMVGTETGTTQGEIETVGKYNIAEAIDTKRKHQALAIE